MTVEDAKTKKVERISFGTRKSILASQQLNISKVAYEYMISKEKTISADMLNIAKYYLCLALARKKTCEFFLKLVCLIKWIGDLLSVSFFGEPENM